MSALSYMRRRISGTYEFRRKLPEKLAGKPVPLHMRESFATLINEKTGRFKGKLIRSLGTKEPKEAKSRNHREAQHVADLFSDAERAFEGERVTIEVTDADLAEITREVIAERSKWFGRYLRETCDIRDANKVFHSFRHSFKRMTRDAGLPEEVHDALTGHSSGGGIGRQYGRGFSLEPLFRAVDQVSAPDELRGYRGLPRDLLQE